MNDDDTFTVPQNLKMLAAALRPVAARLAQTPLPNVTVAPFMSLAESVFDWLLRFNAAIEPEVKNLMRDVIARPDVTEREVWRAVGRLEYLLDDMLKLQEQVFYSSFQPGQIEGKRLLLAGLGDYVGQIHDWLIAIIDAIDDPRAAIQQSGIQADDEQVTLEFCLTLRASPYFEKFVKWLANNARGMESAKNEAYQHKPDDVSPKEKSGMGFWCKIALIAIGLDFLN